MGQGRDRSGVHRSRALAARVRKRATGPGRQPTDGPRELEVRPYRPTRRPRGRRLRRVRRGPGGEGGGPAPDRAKEPPRAAGESATGGEGGKGPARRGCPAKPRASSTRPAPGPRGRRPPVPRLRRPHPAPLTPRPGGGTRGGALPSRSPRWVRCPVPTLPHPPGGRVTEIAQGASRATSRGWLRLPSGAARRGCGSVGRRQSRRSPGPRRPPGQGP